ncbi:N-acetyltransferase [Paenalcaligenes niemegkensis]|uniref:GNAT family N-acetyltransferase n=1 Tax=Paenalcaligenes niemegkensis TaxID=2895469 RepID=UPI001EE7E3AE|nr:GNAT family N-acetyltransferase [Paenalcaligenes niemegkensis]MCQ9615679.1 N-acetyltransferase [Paenalcaligenes niemegkensis]
MSRTVHHNVDQQRFEILEDNVTCVLDYRLSNNVLTVTHTGVPQVVGGRGVAADLTAAALEYVKNHNLKVIPQCSYTAAYINRHPEHKNLVA